MRSLDAFYSVQLLLSDLAFADGSFAVLCYVFARADVVVDAVLVLDGTGCEDGVREENVEHQVVWC